MSDAAVCRKTAGYVDTVAHVVIRRVGREPADRLRIVGRAVLGDPERGDAEAVVAEHVEQRHAADDGAEQLRPLGQRGADEQAAVRAPGDRQPLGRRDPVRDQPGRRRDEVVEHVLLVAEHAGAVPALAVLAAAAQDRQRVGPAALEERDRRGRPGGQHADVEAAVAGEQGGRVPSRGSPLRWARNSGMRVPSREVTITRSTSNAAGSTGASSARQTTLFGAATQLDVEDRGRREEAREPVEELGDVARARERRQRARAPAARISRRAPPFRSNSRRRAAASCRNADREPTVEVDDALEHVLSLGDDLAPVRARRVTGIDREDPPARRAAGGEKVDAIVEHLDDLEPRVLAGRHGDRRLGSALRTGEIGVVEVHLALRPPLRDADHQPASVRREIDARPVGASRPSPKILRSCAGSSPRRWKKTPR